MAITQPKILIVDDEEDLCEILQFNLEGEGFTTESAFSAESALKKDLKKFDLILLDVMMEKISGFKLTEILRKDLKIEIPIIFITAKTEENDMLTGFNIGGDDFIKKPFSIKEVIVRVKTLLKRSMSKGDESQEKNLVFEGFKIDIHRKKLFLDEKKIELTKKEFEILLLLAKNMGRSFLRGEIMSRVWGKETIVEARTVDVHITRLRKKIGKYAKNLKNSYGFGYSFELN